MNNEVITKSNVKYYAVAKLDVAVKKFIVWLNYESNWRYDSTRDLWVMDGFKNRTTDELFEHYLKTRNYGK